MSEHVIEEFFIRDSGHIREVSKFDSEGKLLQTGFVMEGHTHNFFHLTVFAMGKWRVRRFHPIIRVNDKNQEEPALDADGKQLYHELPAEIAEAGSYRGILANCRHRFELLEGPGKYLCIYTHKDPDSHAIVDRYGGWRDGYG